MRVLRFTRTSHVFGASEECRQAERKVEQSNEQRPKRDEKVRREDESATYCTMMSTSVELINLAQRAQVQAS